MGTGIEWTDETWNPTTGCSKLSPGCKNCYAKREWARLSRNPGTVYYGRQFEDVQCHPERLGTPKLWSRPRRIFVDSMSDLFHEAVPDAFICEVLEVARQCEHHTFQILTKRAERMADFFSERERPGWNVQLGVSCENQMEWEHRVPHLLRTPCHTRFVSAEPLLGLIDGRGRTAADVAVSVPPIAEWPLAQLNWVIVGGESGPDARAMHPKHAQWLRDQCVTAGVRFFFKQWGEWLPEGQVRYGLVAQPDRNGRTARHDFGDGVVAWRVGKKCAARLLDGQAYEEMPARMARA